ncbi:hypothetical protein D3C83_278340 [compost metagenome]
MSPLTIWRWKKRTRRNSGTVAETTAATAYMTLPASLIEPRKLEIFGIIVWLLALSSIAVTAKSL